MRPLYHYLDPFWARFPFPASHAYERSEFSGIRVLRMSRVYFGHEVLPVFCYGFEGTMVDTGISSVAGEIAEFARTHRIGSALLTHHHEDHSGNAALLAREGTEVFASAAGVRLVRRRLPRRFYQHALWGEAEGVAASAVTATVPFGRFEARVIPAVGHSVDQVAYLVPEKGWLFSGDAFVAEKIKVFRGDEDFYDTVETMRRFLLLDFDALLCAHRPRFSGGKEAIRGKLAWLVELEGRVKTLYGKGYSVRAIARHLALTTSSAFYVLTFGDATTANLVRSVVKGPVTRVEIDEALRE